MKVMKSRVVPSYTHNYVDKITCDICGKNVEPSSLGSVSEVIMAHKEGYSYGDCGNTDTKIYDICGRCFAIKVEPVMLREFGIVPRVDNCDW